MSEPLITSAARPTALWRDAGWWAVTAAFALNGMLFGAWAARVPDFKQAFSLEPAALGLLLLALAGGAIVSFPFAGGLSERFGAERVTIACAMIYCPALLALALAPTTILLAVALFVFGTQHGAMDVAMNGWGAKVEARLKRSTMSIFHAMFSFGAGLGAASGYAAVRLGFSPAWHFLVVAVIGGAVALWVMIPARGAAPPRADRATRSRSIFSLPSGPLLLVGTVAFAASMGEGAMADWSAVYLEILVQASKAEAALGYAAFSATMVLTRLSGGVLVHWLGPVAATRFSGLIAFTGLAVAILADSLGLALTGFALVGMGYAVLMPLAFSRAANDPDLPPGRAIASVATVGYGGLLLGPPIVGFVAQLAGLQASFGMLALLALAAVALAPVLRVE
ncbi:Fucose permease [Paracoccus isoporae]|uniref:Fucose permease n=1 Tax=Paracoccus isoporae TaxID=591205 RepID=A0A1G7E725_9RHOB|nr:MFS transporter [Paracoccus isoporae]SDE59290.1 Fucose permease [Paracoccus isoporae]